MTRRRRPLRPEEEELWHTVARTAHPLHPDKPRPEPIELPPSLSRPRPKVPAPTPVEPFRVGALSRMAPTHQLVPDLSSRLATAPLKMDAKAFARMSRGKLAPEARIDLHGMTLAEARPELVRFVLNAQSDGLRLVLVITGKGRAVRRSRPDAAAAGRAPPPASRLACTGPVAPGGPAGRRGASEARRQRRVLRLPASRPLNPSLLLRRILQRHDRRHDDLGRGPRRQNHTGQQARSARPVLIQRRLHLPRLIHQRDQCRRLAHVQVS